MHKPVLLLALLLLSGCGLFRDAVERNEARLDRLAVNMTRENVHTIMGTVPKEIAQQSGRRGRHAYREESYMAGGHEWEVLYYQTSRPAEGGTVTDAHLTPVVLLDGLLVGWGRDFWRDTAAKNNLTTPRRVM